MLARWVPAVAWLALALHSAHGEATSLTFGATGVLPDAEGGVNAAVQPQPNMSAVEHVASRFNRSAATIIDPFTPTPVPSAIEPPTPTPVPTTASPRSTQPTRTPTPTTVTTDTQPSNSDRDVDDIVSTTSEDSSGSMARHKRTRHTRRPRPVSDDATATLEPTFAPQEFVSETESLSPSPSPSSRRPNAIEYDVPANPSSSDDETETDGPGTEPPKSSPSPSPPTTTHAPPTTTVPTQTQLPSPAPTTSAAPQAPPDDPKPVGLVTPPPKPDGPYSAGREEDKASMAGNAMSSSLNGTMDGNAGDGSTSSGGGESLESSTESGSSRFSMGTASIMSIVGVIVGICVIVSLFVLISRRKFGDDDDDVDVMAYGGAMGGRVGGLKPHRPSIVRLSPTFLMNSLGPAVPGQPMEPEVGSLSPQHIMPSNRGRRPTGAMPVESPVVMGAASSPRQSSIAGGPSPSAFDSSTDIDTRSSDGWSSVLESEFDHRAASRCTRDTRFTNMTISQRYSEYNPSEITGRTGSSRQFSRRTGSHAPRSMDDEDATNFYGAMQHQQQQHAGDDDDDAYSVMACNVDQAKRANGTARESAASSVAGYSDYRSTDHSYVSGRYTGDSHINF